MSSNTTLHRMALLVAAAAAFGLGPLAGRLGPVIGSAAMVGLALLLALAASGAVGAVSLAAGAVGAFASGILMQSSAPLAGALLLALCYAERTLRVRTPAGRGVHLALAALAGALAGGLSAAYAGADLAVQAVVVIVCAVLAALPLWVDADDPLAHALDEIAAEVPKPAKSALEEGAELCRAADPALLDPTGRRQAAETWRTLLKLAQARLRLERAPKKSGQGAAVIRRLDERIAHHVSALGLMYAAADVAQAAEVSLDDEAVRSIEARGESLDEMSRAMVEP